MSNKLFGFVALLLGLCVMTAIYVVYLQKEEEEDHVYRTRVVSITDDDKLFFGRDPITVTDLSARTTALIQNEGARKMIYLSPGGSVKQSRIIAFIALIRLAGHDRIGLATEIRNGKTLGAIETAISVSTLACEDNRRPGIPRVIIDAEGPANQVIRLDDRRLEAEGLFAELKEALRGKDERVVYVRAHKQVEYREVTSILALIKRAGASKIEFETECESMPPSVLLAPGQK